jgi:hypothetical protein
LIPAEPAYIRLERRSQMPAKIVAGMATLTTGSGFTREALSASLI